MHTHPNERRNRFEKCNLDLHGLAFVCLCFDRFPDAWCTCLSAPESDERRTSSSSSLSRVVFVVRQTAQQTLQTQSSAFSDDAGIIEVASRPRTPPPPMHWDLVSPLGRPACLRQALFTRSRPWRAVVEMSKLPAHFFQKVARRMGQSKDRRSSSSSPTRRGRAPPPACHITAAHTQASGARTHQRIDRLQSTGGAAVHRSIEAAA